MVAAPACSGDPAVAVFLNAQDYLERQQQQQQQQQHSQTEQNSSATGPGGHWDERSPAPDVGAADVGGPSDTELAQMSEEEYANYLVSRTLDSLIDVSELPMALEGPEAIERQVWQDQTSATACSHTHICRAVGAGGTGWGTR